MTSKNFDALYERYVKEFSDTSRYKTGGATIGEEDLLDIVSCSLDGLVNDHGSLTDLDHDEPEMILMLYSINEAKIIYETLSVK